MTASQTRSTWLRSGWLWTGVAVVLIALVALVDVTFTGPRITVLWRANVAPADRLALERRYDLKRGEPHNDAPGTWNYRLGDWSRENIERLVHDPAAEDTGYIDRSTYTAEDPDRSLSKSGDAVTLRVSKPSPGTVIR